MATEKIDGIEFYVDVDTAGAVSSTKVIDNTTKKMEGSFKKLDTQVTKSSKAVKTGLASMGQGAGRVGVQIQQLVGQIQGGQSAMLALSQQSADIGIVLGAPLLGAIAGLAASLAGVLLPGIFKATEGIISLDESISKLTKNFDSLSQSQQSVARSVIIEKIKEQKKEVVGLSKEVNELQSRLIIAERSQTGRFFERVLGEDPDEIRAKLVKVKGSLTTVNLAIKESEKNLNDLGGKTDKYKESLDNISNGLKSQILSLVAGEEAAFRYATAQQLGLKVGERIPENIEAQIQALFRLKQAQEDATKQKIKDAAEERSLKASKKGAESFAGGLVSRGLSESERLALDEEKLEELRAQGLLNLELYEEAKTSITLQQEELRKRSIQQNNALILSSSANFFDALAGIAMAASGEQSKAYKALFAVSKGFAIAQASLNLGRALSEASALPYPVNIPAYIQAGVQGAQIASQIAGVTYGGGRENGGPAYKGSLYEVGEKNKPEIFQSGGKQYMIPGNNGNVISNADMQGSGQSVQLIINNLPGQSATVSDTTSDDGKMRRIALQVVSEQSAQVGSKMNQNINKNHNVTNRQGSNRRN